MNNISIIIGLCVIPYWVFYAISLRSMLMKPHPIREIIEACDKAISERNFDALMGYYAEDAALVIKPGMVAKGKDDIKKSICRYC
ncbi:hypothetical protein SOASR015_19550 [Pectobacterium carotovorum subsp. carotovorum]|nr:hypothetical protein SOASR015_19550 [Pectobacterium carotovorum subsp. carotovorum]GLX55785.1 hypothetical protein Pcaca02_10940 [Pectobacterium carotovorum subsp. carotovorum]